MITDHCSSTTASPLSLVRLPEPTDGNRGPTDASGRCGATEGGRSRRSLDKKRKKRNNSCPLKTPRDVGRWSTLERETIGGLNSPACAPQMVNEHFWKNAFLTHFHPFLTPKWPIFKAF